MGQASRPAIRRAALAGTKPRHPLPLKGRKERYAEEKNSNYHSQKYKDQFEAYRPSYGGDAPSGGGSITPGGTGDNAIDISGFVSPETKNNLDLAAYAIQAWENGWGYVWGTYGNVLSQSLFDYKLQQYPDGVGQYADFIRANWLNRRTADCVGLIKGYGWLNAETLSIEYGTNGMRMKSSLAGLATGTMAASRRRWRPCPRTTPSIRSSGVPWAS